jgi:hypothetical protein
MATVVLANLQGSQKRLAPTFDRRSRSTKAIPQPSARLFAKSVHQRFTGAGTHVVQHQMDGTYTHGRGTSGDLTLQRSVETACLKSHRS